MLQNIDIMFQSFILAGSPLIQVCNSFSGTFLEGFSIILPKIQLKLNPPNIFFFIQQLIRLIYKSIICHNYQFPQFLRESGTKSILIASLFSSCSHVQFSLAPLQIFQAIQFLILGHHMHIGKEEVEEQKMVAEQKSPQRPSSEEEESYHADCTNRHLAFQKNYPKNIFIPMIEHLSERGLQREYEACVGTRENFQGKNVVSLAEIHRVMSQEWFSDGINLSALVSSMSNKILMNSKIKKKLFHLLLIRELFTIPLHDPREFKKQVSKKANEVSESKLPDDPLFSFPSALIYLLHIFAQGLEKSDNSAPRPLHDISRPQDDERRSETEKSDHRARKTETSSKLEYKLYISRIIVSLNGFQGDSGEFLDLIQQIKRKVEDRQAQVRQKYSLPEYVPQWSYFNAIVINNCYLIKRNKQRLTYSLLNSWIQEFKDRATSLKGFIEIAGTEQTKEPDRDVKFTPIVLISPP